MVGSIFYECRRIENFVIEMFFEWIGEKVMVRDIEIGLRF